jgi:hypothetical protein
VLSDGRYLFFVATIVPVVIAGAWRFRLARAATAALVAVGLIAFLTNTTFLEGATRPSTTPIIDALEDEGYGTAVAQYWIAYQMTFESDERVIASPNDIIRYEPYARTVAADRPAFVFERWRTPEEYRWVTDNLTALDIDYTIIEAGEFLAILPEHGWVPASALPTTAPPDESSGS